MVLQEQEQEIQIAFEFLTHPKTLYTTLQDKIEFLKQKGIQPQSILLAIQKWDRQAAEQPAIIQMVYAQSSNHWISSILGFAALFSAAAGIAAWIWNWKSSIQEAESEENKKYVDFESVQEARMLRMEIDQISSALRESKDEYSKLLREWAAVKNAKNRAQQTISSTVDVQSGTYQKAELSNSIKALFSSK
jgi:hypothetical protein